MSTAREQHEVDETKASHVLAWIKELLNYGGLRDDAESIPDQIGNGRDFQRCMKDGIIFCKMTNIIQPGTIDHYQVSSLPFMQMDNIGKFLRACEEHFGIPQKENFLTGDLYELTNLKTVIDGLYLLGRTAGKTQGYKGPSIKGQNN